MQHVNIVGGVGVGGGSLVYAAVLLEPKPAFFRDPAWKDLGVDWQSELKPHYLRAAQMLGLTVCPTTHIQDEWLKQTAISMGAGESHSPVPLGITFGSEEEVPDPYFGGAGPVRRGCKQCGNCLAGCEYNAKNSLDKNYLYLAEQRGATILPRHKAVMIQPVEDGYLVQCLDPLNPKQNHAPITASKVILAAGVLGTLELLFRCRQAGSLTQIYQHLLVSKCAPIPKRYLLF